MAGSRASLQCPNVYDALRRKGYSKTKAAKIANAQCAPGISKGTGAGRVTRTRKRR